MIRETRFHRAEIFKLTHYSQIRFFAVYTNHAGECFRAFMDRLQGPSPIFDIKLDERDSRHWSARAAVNPSPTQNLLPIPAMHNLLNLEPPFHLA